MMAAGSMSLKPWRSAPVWMEPYASSDLGTTIQRTSYQLPLLRARTDLRVEPRKPERPRAEGPFPLNKGDDRLLPGNAKPVYLECFDPYVFVPRKRKVLPNISDNQILDFDYKGNRTSLYWSQGSKVRDVSSVTGRQYTRRKFLPGPSTHLVVDEFDGGVPGPAPMPSKWFLY